jgi:hypothetical protein
MAFSFLLTQVTSCELDLQKGFAAHSFISRVVKFAILFFRKEIIEPALPGAFGLPPQLDHVSKCSNWVSFGVTICESKFGFFI